MIKRKQIAYRCPACGVATVGFFGRLPAVSDMLRLKCECGEGALTVTKRAEGGIKTSVPCVYCRDEHSFIISEEVAERESSTLLPCPYSGMNILFLAEEGEMSGLLEKSATELSAIMTSLEADDISDIQPTDVDEAEASPDPAIYDVFNFLLRDLESEGAVRCPCDEGKYDLRYTSVGMEIYCTHCGASREFAAITPTMAEEYLTLSEITLK